MRITVMWAAFIKRDVFVQAVVRRVLVVIGGAEKDRLLALTLLTKRQGSNRDGERD